jgi:hypothetical protein
VELERKKNLLHAKLLAVQSKNGRVRLDFTTLGNVR